MTLLSNTINGLNHGIPVHTPYHSNSKSEKKMMKTCQTYLPKKMASAYFSYRSEEASKLTWLVSLDDQISGVGFMHDGKLNPLRLKFDKRGTLHWPSTGIHRIEYDFFLHLFPK
jgi:hypothetical protein